jgi:tyrosyl-tRNA synthetase
MTEESAAEASPHTKARLGLVRRNAAELIGEAELAEKLEGKRNVSAYIGRATTGPLHLGHVISVGKLLDLQKAGIRTKILIADIHAALDDQKAKWDELDKRSEYTRKCIELSFDWSTYPEFVRGSDYQLGKEYVRDVFKMASLATIERAKRAASEVTRMKNPKVSELLYPVFQALDEQYLDVDMQVGGLDQRHIFVFAREYLPLLGYEKRAELMMPIVTSMHGPGAKMSSSEPESNIKVYEAPESITKKINRAYCPEGVVEDNFILQLTRFVIFSDQISLTVEREARFGGEVKFDSYEQVERSFLRKEIHPKDLKAVVSEYLIKRFSRVRAYFDSNPEVLKELGQAFLSS